MTAYDPFAFGQVNLKADPGAAPDSPDDMLFAGGTGASRNAPPADSSWGLLDADVDSLLPGAKAPASSFDFGSEVLGAEAAQMPSAAPVRPRPSAVPRPVSMEPAAPSAGPRAAEAPRREVGTRSLGTPAVAATPPAVAPVAQAKVEAAAKAPTYVARKPSSVGRIGGRSGLASTLVPAVLFLGGGSTTAWLWAMQQNVMMAAITGALTITAAVFARILLRG